MDTQKSANLKLVYEGEMEHKLREFGKKLDEMKEKADQTTEQSLTKLKLKQAEADANLQTMKASSQEAWTELQHGMDNAWEEMQSAWNEMKSASEKALAKFNK